MDSDLRLYDVTVGAHKTRMHLNQADADRLGADATLAAGPASQPLHPPAPAPDTKSRLVTSNKMRGTDDPSSPGHR